MVKRKNDLRKDKILAPEGSLIAAERGIVAAVADNGIGLREGAVMIASE